MPISLLVAPGGAGKTDYALQLVRQTTDGLHQLARVCVANRQQAMSWQRRLVQGPGDRPGHIGVEVMTFDDLYAACLDAAGWTVTRIDETVEHRLIRAAAQQLDLAHYGALRQRPGFIQELRRLIGEFKSTQLRPQQLADGIEALGNEARLREVVQLYKRYNDLLQEQQWTDSRGLGWMALAALQGDSASHAYAWPRAHLWPLLIVDGFDSFTQTQLALLKQLGQRVDRLIITLTGDAGADTPRRAHRRFHRTRRELEQRLNVTAQPLPARSARPAPRGALAHLRENLFVGSTTQQPDDGAVQMLEAPTPAVEVREALRWLKRRIVDEGARPHELALLARDLQPYTPFIQQTAAEFQLPVYILGGLSLAQNPCIAALLNLLRLMLPADDNGAQQQTDSWQPALPRRPVLAALRSPYFDWRSALDLTATDVAQLDVLARQWRVVGGRKQWLEALSAAAATPQSARPDPESGERVASAPQGETARALREKFRSFLHRIRPLRGQHPWREHVSWLEALLGPDDAEPTSHSSTDNSLRVIACARAGAEAGENDQLQVARRDIAALHKLKNILRSLLWAEDAGLLNPPLSFTEFVEELASAVDTARYQSHAAGEAILVAPLLQTRGVPFRAVALVGLAEGTFPATLTEDPFLRESDRRRLREEHHFSLESSVESEEAEYFYDALTRPWHKLLLTRPRLADSGAPWEPSPFWEEVRRLLALQPRRVESEEAPPPSEAASVAELMESLCQTEQQAARAWCDAQAQGRWKRVQAAGDLFRQRYEAQQSAHDGSLHEMSPALRTLFDHSSVWSATGLERYLTCPFYFFVGDVLQKEVRAEPEVGLDARQLGSIYHNLLERVFQSLPRSRRNDAKALQAALDKVAPPLLDRAPHNEGFRATAWWEQTRQEIIANVRRSLHEMTHATSAQFQPTHFELKFSGSQALTINDGQGNAFRLQGIIDRVDLDEQGRLRIIDYKTAGPYQYGASALQQGRKIQLPLYAMAAEKALQLGRVVDGFYWHVQHAESSSLRLADLGPDEAMRLARRHAWRAVRAVRAGEFRPEPPAEGCPTYCPAAAFCWHYSPPRSWS